MAGEQKKVGTIKCFCCGGEAEVRQAAARGRHFYLVCQNCGTMQGQKPAMQTRIWREAEFLPGITVIKPNNVTDDQPALTGQMLPAVPDSSPKETVEPEPDEPDGEPDYDPESDPDEPDSEPETGSSKKGLIAVLITGVAIVGGIIFS